METGWLRTASSNAVVSGRMDDAAATGTGNGAAVLAVEAIEATGGVAGPCEAAGSANGSLALDWATAGADFEKNCGN